MTAPQEFALGLSQLGDRWFESISLHQRVCSEPDFLDQGAESFSGGPEVQLSIDVGRGRINTSSNPRGNGHDQA